MNEICLPCVFSECAVPCVVGVIGGAVQVFRSKNYSVAGFCFGLLSSFFVALVFCLVSKDYSFFAGHQNTVNAISGLLGVSSHWVLDVLLPRIRQAILKKAESEVNK